ncbi:MAG: hypothetical protein IJ223_02400 [Clostridia bacterium]|nr:hypothetical protein [Clostridia bacterium]
MKKYIKIIIGIIIVILVVVGLFFLKNEDVKETVNNSIVQSKEVKDAFNTIKKEANNIINNTVDNTISEEVKNEAENQNDEVPAISNPENVTTNEQNNDEKAINMVKQDWGEDNNVTFKIDEKNENGKYVIGVVDKNTTRVLVWYEVDIRNNTLQEKY